MSISIENCVYNSFDIDIFYIDYNFFRTEIQNQSRLIKVRTLEMSNEVILMKKSNDWI